MPRRLFTILVLSAATTLLSGFLYFSRLVVFAQIVPSPNTTFSIPYTLRAGPFTPDNVPPADACWKSAGAPTPFTPNPHFRDSQASITFEDEPWGLLYSVTGGGVQQPDGSFGIGADDAAFIYVNGNLIQIATRHGGITSEATTVCNIGRSGTTIVSSWFLNDSGAPSFDSVTISGIAHDTYENTSLINTVAFLGPGGTAVWNTCEKPGQITSNGSCGPVFGSLILDYARNSQGGCNGPCDISVSWSSNSLVPDDGSWSTRVEISTDGSFGTMFADSLNSSGAETATLPSGSHEFCFFGKDGFGTPIVFVCETVEVSVAGTPRLSVSFSETQKVMETTVTTQPGQSLSVGFFGRNIGPSGTNLDLYCLFNQTGANLPVDYTPPRTNLCTPLTLSGGQSEF